MAKPPKKSDKVLELPPFVDLPVLTEKQVTETTILPVLTEALAPGAPSSRTMDTGMMDAGMMDAGMMDTGTVDTGMADTGKATGAFAPLVALEPRAAKGGALAEAQYQHISEQIAPQLEALLREKLAARLGSLWNEIWSETQAELPRLIRAELEKPAPRSRK